MRRILGVTTLAVVALSVVLIGTASAAKPAPTTASGCPNGGTYLVDPNVGADFTGTTTRTYTFSSWMDQSSVNGVPGLVGYCVYTNQTPTTVTPKYGSWKASKANQTFSFTRPNGEKTNIPLDGTTDIEVGEAVFGTAPSSQTILLHVSDAATCQALYGGDATTCYVLPGPKPGPVCDAAGDMTGVGYTNIPKGVLDCPVPSEAFEAQQADEFGDEVELNVTSGHITSLTVEFQSFGCGTSGTWWQGATNPCVTAPNATFTHPITANIYGESTAGLPGALLANGTVTTIQTIPYRPSADPTHCQNPGIDSNGGDDTGKWYNAASQTCVNSIGTLLTFTFPSGGPAVPPSGKVIWTVAFNTSHYGSVPIGPASCSIVNPTDPGCGYDSLNVGSKTFNGAPYVGSFVDPNGAFLDSTYFPTDANGGYCDGGVGGLDFLRADTAATGCWAGFQPLGQINVGP